MPDSLPPHGLYSSWNSPGQNAGVGSHSLHEGIFPTWRSNPGLPHSRQIVYQLSHGENPDRSSVQFSSVAQSCPTLWDPIRCSTPAVTPQETDPDLAVSFQKFPAEACVTDGLLQGWGHLSVAICAWNLFKEVAIITITST